jgi:hypothetical protein
LPPGEGRNDGGGLSPMSFPRKRESSRRNEVMQARERYARCADLDPRLRGDDRSDLGLPPSEGRNDGGGLSPLSFPRKRESSQRNEVMQVGERYARCADLDPRLRGDDRRRGDLGLPPSEGRNDGRDLSLVSFPRKRESSQRNEVMQVGERYARCADLDPRSRGDDRRRGDLGLPPSEGRNDGGGLSPMSFPRKRESSRRNEVMQARERYARCADLDSRLRGDDRRAAYPSISAVTCAATERDSPSRS